MELCLVCGSETREAVEGSAMFSWNDARLGRAVFPFHDLHLAEESPSGRDPGGAFSLEDHAVHGICAGHDERRMTETREAEHAATGWRSHG